ncbi:MAG: replication-associated recombination protein A [Microbacteriaceae bacterium]|tara:strand:+ start:1404 stop:2738 length:1335 start_codon:yes stop_codon:yes gene_type:complete
MSDQGLWGAPVPLAVALRPVSLDEVVGQDHALVAGGPLRMLANPDHRGAVTSVILWGPPGTGKTTLASVIARSSGRNFVELSAVTAGVKDVREVVEHARRTGETSGVAPVLFLDEIHRFSKAQQDALLPAVENGVVVLIAATTENPSFSIIAPLLSRSVMVTLQPLEPEHIESVLTRALTDERGLANRVGLEPEAMENMVRFSGGDARKALTALEASAGVAISRAVEGEIPLISAEHVGEAVDRALVRYDRDGDQHYDVISAFIKSVRGSDADAALHYLARMLEAGEDARFIARRLIILASEDIGLADPQALPLAVAAAEAMALIGLPEGRIPLAQVTIYLALAPKSNAAYVAINDAQAAIREGKIGEVPVHLRDAHYPGATAMGHGRGYRYPHDDVAGIVPQAYAPEPVAEDSYYRPSTRGFEAELKKRQAAILEILGRARPS